MKIKTDHRNRKVYAHIFRLERKCQNSLKVAHYKIGKRLKETARKQILDKSTKTGKVTVKRLGRRRLRHQASAPGESPANFTGRYRRSIDFQPHGWNELEFGAGKDGRARYSEYLELGTPRMAPRPGLGNAVKSEERNTLKIYQNELQKGLTK